MAAIALVFFEWRVDRLKIIDYLQELVALANRQARILVLVPWPNVSFTLVFRDVGQVPRHDAATDQMLPCRHVSWLSNQTFFSSRPRLAP